MKKALTAALLAASLALPLHATAEFEPNDTPATATRLVSGADMPGQLHHRDDVDRFVIEAPAGSNLRVELARARATTSGGMWKLSITRVEDGRLLARMESHLAETEVLNVGAGEAGEYEVLVQRGHFHGTHEYRLKVTVQDPAAEEPPEEPTSGGILDGIWQKDSGEYISIQQKGTQLVVILLGNPLEYGWEALVGSLIGNSARIATLIGVNDVEMELRLLDEDSFQATQISCLSADPSRDCPTPDGETFVAERIF